MDHYYFYPPLRTPELDVVETRARLVALLDDGIDPYEPDQYGETMMHFAAHQSAEIVQALVGRGVDPNSVNKAGDTPMLAAHLATCAALLEAGAEPRFSIPGPASKDLEESTELAVSGPDEVIGLVMSVVYKYDDDALLSCFAKWAGRQEERANLLVPRVACRLVLSRRLALGVLEFGMRHSCPSTNRHFVLPVLRQRGRAFVMRAYLEAFQVDDQRLAEGVPGMYYWTRARKRRWTFLGEDDEPGALRAEQALYDAVIERFLAGATGALARGCIAMISLAEDHPAIAIEPARILACQQHAAASDDSYVRNRGARMVDRKIPLQDITK